MGTTNRAPTQSSTHKAFRRHRHAIVIERQDDETPEMWAALICELETIHSVTRLSDHCIGLRRRLGVSPV